MSKQLNKAGSAAGAGYIVGTGEGFNLIEFPNDGVASHKLGRIDDKPLTHTIDDRIQSVDITLGESDAYKLNNHGAYSDRTYPVASGYNTKGVPTYGDGRYLVASGYAVDTNFKKSTSKFNYMAQNGNQDINYSSLAT